MTKNKTILVFITIFFILAMVIMPTISNATSPIDNPGHYKPGSITTGDEEIIKTKANNIIGAVVTVGIVASVITLLILGIKYMVGSMEEKAEYKKSMVPYLIGAVLLFTTSTIVSIIASITQETFK